MYLSPYRFTSLLLVAAVVAAPVSAAPPAPSGAGPGLHYYTPPIGAPDVRVVTTDVCIYGGTPAGIAAALELGRSGVKCCVLEQSAHLGGMASGGLSHTDVGEKDSIGGIAEEFYQRVGAYYHAPIDWSPEPHVAEGIFDAMATESGAQVFFGQFLKSVTKSGAKMTAIKLETGLTVNAQEFVDASYEGDLMAKAGVSYTVGREANAVYGESLNGVQIHKKHQFDLPVSPYVVDGDPSSGLLPGINPADPGQRGTGDKRIQAYVFRLCVTRDPANRIPFPKPTAYDPKEYVLLARYLAKGWPEKQVFQKFDTIRNGKADKNNHGATSTDFIGRNYDYPDGDYAMRERIFQQHVAYQQGLMWFMGNDPSVPDAIQARWSEWGLCKDEFQDTGGWSRQLYIREARRMVSDYVMTEHNCRGKEVASDGVALGSYTMDSHNCERIVKDGHVLNEGDVQKGGFPPYPISYRSIVPKKSECQNLIVPVCLSASHIAYGSIRMEPVFMMLGQSAADAAVLAIQSGSALQDVSYDKLRARLLAGKQILEAPKAVPAVL